MRAHWAASVLVLAMACSDGDRSPDDLLPRERFVQVLSGSLLIEARVNQELMLDKRADGPVEQYYDSLFAEQGVSAEAFERTYEHYMQDPKALKGIYEEVLLDLQQRADSAR